jgi:hypothetical protein
MPTAKKSIPAPVKAKKAAAPAKKVAKAAAPAAMKPIKTAFNKTTLTAHLAQVTGVDAKSVKGVLAALEATMHASIAKKGLGTFLLPGMLKITAVSVAARPKRKGIDPFTKVERMFAAKPASVKLKVRALKKLKDASL